MSVLKFLLSPASFKAPGIEMHGPALLIEPAIITLIAGFIASLVWVCRDARKRDRNRFVALLFILLTGWPASFIWWLWLRPPLRSSR